MEAKSYMNEAKKSVRKVYDNPKAGFQALWSVVEFCMKESYMNGQLKAEGNRAQDLERAWEDGFEAGIQEARSNAG